MTDLAIRNGLVLIPSQGEPQRGEVVIESGVVRATGSSLATRAVDEIDASGALVLPGIVDVHGDAFERSIMPRGGVNIDVADALDDNDAQLLAAGITTAFISVTDSWEPGLRSRDVLRSIIKAPPGRGPERRIHVRHERCNTDDFTELTDWIRGGEIHMLSFNDHTPGAIAHTDWVDPARAARAGVSTDEFVELMHQAVERRAHGLEQELVLASVCREAACPAGSHDSGSDADFDRDIALQVSFAEFPLNMDLAKRYIDAGIHVLAGAPNLVRGTSHLGGVSAREAISCGAADMLCSDYHYPSVLRAPFVLARLGLCTFEQAWSFVSEAPAAVAGLVDRGRIEEGAAADVIVVEPPADGAGARVRAVVVGGEVVYRVAAR
ncbi:MAG: alpha-D-ribose 1-methylphosphonate 5-triphosphate diphosphatase [Acidimicrobiales bacterium]